MPIFPIPDIVLGTVYELTPDFLRERGITLLLLDLDNTLAPYSLSAPTKELKHWVTELKESGVTLWIVSNNRGDRPEIFARELGVGYTKRANKPFTSESRQLLKRLGAQADSTALVGDQIYTDVLCAKLLGVTAVIVEPLCLSNPLLRVRRIFEKPFRYAGTLLK